MERRILLALPALLCGCGSGPSLPKPLPAALGGGWRLKGEEEAASGQAPEEVRKLGLRRASRATYEGPATIAATVYEMTGSAGAFEAAQKWCPAPGALAFHAGRYFVVAESPGAPNAVLNEFAGEMERALKD